MITLAYGILALIVISSALIAVCTPRLIRAAIALFFCSAAIALLFFLLDAPYAGSIQLSVGAGLMSTLFIIVITLTESMRGGQREE